MKKIILTYIAITVLFTLFLSLSAHAKGSVASHIYHLGDGVAHPSFIGYSNPAGYIYNTSVSTQLFLSTLSSSSSTKTYNYDVGISFGKGGIGGGLRYLDSFTTGETTTSTSNKTIAIEWGIGAQAFSKLAIGLSGGTVIYNESSTNSINALGFLYSLSSKLNLGLTLGDPTSPTVGDNVAVGLAYSGTKSSFAFDVHRTSSTTYHSTTGYLGFGIHNDSFHAFVNYARVLENSQVSSVSDNGTVSFLVGGQITKSSTLQYSNASSVHKLGWIYVF